MALEWKEASCSAKKHGCSSASEDTSKSKPNVVRFFKKKSTNEKSRAVVSSDEENEDKDLPDNAKISDRASMEKSTSQKSKRAVSSDDEEVSNVVRNSDKRDGNREREDDELGTDIGEAIMELEEAACKIRWLKDVLRFGPDLPTSRWKFIPNKDQ